MSARDLASVYQLHNLSNISTDYMFHEVSGVDCSQKILAGRPHGGLAVLYKRSIADKIKTVRCESRRMCAVTLSLDGHLPLLLINVYMPCDTMSANILNTEYNDVLCEIEALLSKHVGDVLLCGDWNTDTNRSTAQTGAFNDFIVRNELNMCWDNQHATQIDTYANFSLNHFSCIDHFLMSSRLFNEITCCQVDTSPLNPSDHRNIYIKFNQETGCHIMKDSEHKNDRVAWHKVSETQIINYQYEMDALLDNLDIDCINEALTCNDVHCRHTDHLTSCEFLCDKLIPICLEASDASLPKCAAPHGRVPLWNERIKPLRDDSLFWHWLWKEAGRPPTGALATIMRSTRAKYHRAVKEHKRNETDMRREAIAKCASRASNRDLWSELKKLDNKSKVVPNSVDGFTENDDIAKCFAHKYSNLYKSVPTSQEEIAALRREIIDDVQQESQTDFNIINVGDIKKSLGHLRHGKSDGLRGTDSNHFIHCSHKFQILTTMLINTMLIHGHTPSDLLDSVIISIPKDPRGNMCSNDNYRGIALCSALCKIIDYVIIDKYNSQLITSDLQYSFKPRHSTSMCTSVLKEVCSYYTSRNTDVYICMLDASKAFDRVHFGKLFNLLRKRKLPAIVLRLLLDIYTRQRMCTNWNGTRSDFFETSNGVKQGGILSPVLFCVYFDELLKRINDSELGCHIGHLSYASSGYADDVGVISPSIRALQQMLNICDNFADEYNVSFNARKTVCMRVGNNGQPPKRVVRLHGVAIQWKDSIKHLGNIIPSDLSDDNDIKAKTSVFNSQVNKLNNKFRTVHGLLRGKLLQTYCCAWYGCQTWDLVSQPAQCMNVQWNKAVRRTLGIPYDTRTRLLPFIVRGRNFRDQHRARVTKFVDSFMVSENRHVAYIAARARSHTYGPLGRNWVRVRNTIPGRLVPSNAIDQYDAAKCHTIRELLEIRDGTKIMNEFQHTDISFMISELCRE